MIPYRGTQVNQGAAREFHGALDAPVYAPLRIVSEPSALKSFPKTSPKPIRESKVHMYNPEGNAPAQLLEAARFPHRGQIVRREYSLRTLRIFSILLMGLALSLSAGSAAARSKSEEIDLVYVGTYKGQGSQGIYAYRFDARSGHLTSLGLAAESDNPAFLAVDPSRRFLYASNEVNRFRDQPTGAVSAFAIDRATGKLSFLDEVSAQGPGSAHLRVDRTGKNVVVANYGGGSVTVLTVLDNGQLGEASDFARHTGSSVNRQRQQGPHAHSVAFSPDNRFVVVADLGIDQVIVYPFDAAKGKLGPSHSVKVNPGAGPRHLTFSPDGRFLYLVSEMASTVTVFAYEPVGGNLTELQTISTLPKGFSGQSAAAEIQILPSGKSIYASNRGDDSLAVFKVDHPKGTLTLVQRVSTEGKTPRSFAIDPSGSWLLAANQRSNNIVTFRISPKTGRLTPTGQILQLSAPVCIEFVPLP